MNNKNAEYAIITSFKFKDRFVWNFYRKCLIFKIRFRMILRFYNISKVKKYQRKLQDLKLNRYKIIGHSSLLLSLFRGFDKLNIPFTYNKITRYTKYIILCWANAKDIDYIRKLRIDLSNIKCVVTAPTACQYDYEYQYRFAQENCIDFSLVASEWVKEAYKTKMSNIYWGKIVSWASGVVFNENAIGGITDSKACYGIFKKFIFYTPKRITKTRL